MSHAASIFSVSFSGRTMGTDTGFSSVKAEMSCTANPTFSYTLLPWSLARRNVGRPRASA